MSFLNSLTNTDSALAVALWAIAISVALYFTRTPAHRAIKSLSRVLHGSMKIAAKSMMQAEKQLQARNREVLLAAGREASERIIEREFERIENNVRRDVSQCTSLDRMMNEQLTKIEEDYEASKEVPPAPPGWAGVVKAVGEVPSKGDPLVANILEQIHDSIVKSQDQAISAYRESIRKRHAHLEKMQPAWRELNRKADEMKKALTTVIERSQTIDRHMDEYENTVRGTDRAVRMLSASSLHQFLVSGLIMFIAVGGAFINFNLIARPMAEMVGGTTMVGTLKISEIAALVIILVELAMGVFLMESFRITRLFPIIGALPDKTRHRLIYVFFGILFILASVEAGLAYMREILLEDELKTSQMLRGADAIVQQTGGQLMWITTVSQMLMGFILPFALAFVAIPLESFIQSVRTVTGITAAGTLRGLATLFRFLGSAFRYSGELLVHVYDLLCIPLWLENTIKASRHSKSQRPARAPGANKGSSVAPATPMK